MNEWIDGMGNGWMDGMMDGTHKSMFYLILNFKFNLIEGVVHRMMSLKPCISLSFFSL